MHNFIQFFYISVFLGLSLSGCMVAADNKPGGFTTMVFGALIFFLGFKLATKTNLEKWSMKILIFGVCIFFMG